GIATVARFGATVDIHGDWLVVGAPMEASTGIVHVIRVSAGFSATGVPVADQVISPSVAAAYFGSAISIAGGRLAIGYSVFGGDGEVVVYNLSGGTWTTT